MPEHIRTTIRKAIGDLLEGDASLDAVTIYRNRSRPIGLKGADKSAVEILIPREVTTPQGNHCDDVAYERMIEVQLIGYHSTISEDSATDVADLLALKLETVMHLDTTLNGVVLDLWMEGTDFVLDAGAYANAAFSQVWKINVVSSLNAMNS